MKTPEIREFNTTDWILLAGAEPFEGYDWDSDDDKIKEPLVCDGFEYTSSILVADGYGIQLISDDGCSLGLSNNCPDWDQQFARKTLESIVEDVNNCNTDEEVEFLLKEKYGFETLIG